ncbi:hypothetical protein [Halobacterium jilantaiense]|uniref:Uncharacterized protein n=1 Tax=Halobacterium jilantaiense TaxID=355548 RepID=A0A1I0QTM4_9EURY|nr:hypothetical protein [Halobacterium jilantaiense]SEW30972.1 hypothetical protein SAMN04487945_2979 [Halobacterium jilantaiense]
MTNRYNEYLKRRPYPGGLVFVGLVLVGTLVWAVLVQSSESVSEVVGDSGLWVALLVLAPLLYVTYVAAARPNQ